LPLGAFNAVAVTVARVFVVVLIIVSGQQNATVKIRQKAIMKIQ